MTLDQHVKTDNNIETKKNSLGACFAMTIKWIQATKQYDGVTRAWQIGETGAFRIGQAMAQVTWDGTAEKKAITAAGLTCGSTVNDPALATISSDGFHMIVVRSANEGHAMGAWVKSGKYQFFDPNFGLYRATSKEELVAAAAKHCSDNYSSMPTRATIAIS